MVIMHKSYFNKVLLLLLIVLNGCAILRLHHVRSNHDAWIAHAGGQVDKFTYTNSLEALDFSYSQGARLFELDIIATSDRQLVAAHDWKHFKKISNFKADSSDSPLTSSQFLSQRIYNKFTPMNIDIINDWFSKHKDAILVTDKINSPLLMSEKFKFKERLRMELFTWDAVAEAIKYGITPMPSENLVFEKDAEGKLYDLKIQYIAISRRLIEANKEYLLRLKAHKIRTYVYHVNFDKGRDEKYVLKYETKYVYGLYADHLDLLKQN